MNDLQYFREPRRHGREKMTCLRVIPAEGGEAQGRPRRRGAPLRLDANQPSLEMASLSYASEAPAAARRSRETQVEPGGAAPLREGWTQTAGKGRRPAPARPRRPAAALRLRRRQRGPEAARPEAARPRRGPAPRLREQRAQDAQARGGARRAPRGSAQGLARPADEQPAHLRLIPAPLALSLLAKRPTFRRVVFWTIGGIKCYVEPLCIYLEIH